MEIIIDTIQYQSKSATVKIHKPTGNESIKFKCPANLNKATEKTLPRIMQKIADVIDNNSKEFTGVEISGLVIPKGGNFNLSRVNLKPLG